MVPPLNTAAKQTKNQDLTDNHLQSFRKYSTEAPKSSNVSTIAFVVGAIGIGAGIYRYTQQKGASAEEAKQRASAFTGGDQGFIGLKLGAVEVLSHNTKKFRFEFEDKEAVSGLHVACKAVEYREKKKETG